MRSITLYKYSATGTFGYVCYEKENKVCNVFSLPLPISDVGISGGKHGFHSKYDFADTLVEGVTKREILDDNGDLAAVLRWDGMGIYTLFHEGRKVRIYTNEHFFLYLTEKKQIALLQETTKRDVPQYIEETMDGLDLSRAFEAQIEDAVSDSLTALMLAFPMLKFAF